MAREYEPEPIDTTEIRLDPDLLTLTEVLARNTHEVWARGRLAEGWRYGDKRSDTARTHPNLIPYDDLSEADKEYDRHTALEALKAVIALGYDIRKAPID